VENHPNSIPARSGFPWGTTLAGLALAGVIGTGMWHQSTSVNNRQEMDAMRKDVAALHDKIAASNREVIESLEAIRGDLDNTRKETATTIGQTRIAALRRADLVASRLNKLQSLQTEQSTQLSEQLQQIKSSSEETSAKLTDITSDVGNVKTEVASTKSTLDTTIADLRRATGDMGIMSGLIATNSRELAALKEFGERNYYEFTLTRDAKNQKVGDIQIALKKADPKRNRFTIEVLADDKKVEKKDRNINEPIQFYVLSKARQPYELVINEVKKNVISGYLATPKVRMARN